MVADSFWKIKWNTVPKRTRFQDDTFAFGRFGQVSERHRLSAEDPIAFLRVSAVQEGLSDWEISRDPMSPLLDKEIAVF